MKALIFRYCGNVTLLGAYGRVNSANAWVYSGLYSLSVDLRLVLIL